MSSICTCPLYTRLNLVSLLLLLSLPLRCCCLLLVPGALVLDDVADLAGRWCRAGRAPHAYG